MEQELLLKLNQWHEKLDAFFAQSFAKNASKMKCAEGCDLCCQVERSVFAIEAQAIRQYVAAHGLAQTQENQLGHCAFLKDGKCSVYGARPSICRTHGLVLKHQEGHSHCDLNFTQGLPPTQDWLSSETADTVLSTLQIAYEKQTGDSERISLRELWRELTSQRS